MIPITNFHLITCSLDYNSEAIDILFSRQHFITHAKGIFINDSHCNYR